MDDEAYTYDGVGNRETASGVTGSITHNANNELTIYGEISYDYDANGNLIRKSLGSAAVKYIYDAANRLVKVEDDVTSTVIAEYYYDPFGRRLWKNVGGTRTYFFYSEEGLIAEYDENGVEIRSYGYRPDSTWTTDPLFQKVGSTYYWYQNDHLGTPQKLVDNTGTVVWSAQYSSFGNATIEVNTVENPLRFPGMYFDDETGLHYNRFRYYDPGIGRYMRTDPIGFDAGDINLYAYVWNSPVNWRDSMGLTSCDKDKEDFFNWLKKYIPGKAKEMEIDEDFLWALAAKEGSWSRCPECLKDDPENPGQKIFTFDRNKREHMPFGVQHWVPDPKRPGKKKKVNRPYLSDAEAVSHWKELYGNHVKGTKTIEKFAQILFELGYNTETKDWKDVLIGIYYDSIPKYKGACQEICDLNPPHTNKRPKKK